MGERELQKFRSARVFTRMSPKSCARCKPKSSTTVSAWRPPASCWSRPNCAPVDGTVTDLRVHTEGGVVAPGELLLELVPADDRLIVEARVRPQDVDRVRVGLDAGIKLSAFDQRTFPNSTARSPTCPPMRSKIRAPGKPTSLTRIEGARGTTGSARWSARGARHDVGGIRAHRRAQLC